MVSSYHNVIDANLEVLKECFDINSTTALNFTKNDISSKSVAFLPKSCFINEHHKLVSPNKSDNLLIKHPTLYGYEIKTRNTNLAVFSTIFSIN